MKIFIASDHGGFSLKNEIAGKLQNDHDIVDLGPETLDMEDDYPVYAFKVAEKVVEFGGHIENVCGILICRSGIGMSIAANKVDGCYAALCHSVDLASVARRHNNANVLVLDSDYNHENVMAIIEEFINGKFEGGRHARRVQQIADYELTTSEEPLL